MTAGQFSSTRSEQKVHFIKTHQPPKESFPAVCRRVGFIPPTIIAAAVCACVCMGPSHMRGPLCPLPNAPSPGALPLAGPPCGYRRQGAAPPPSLIRTGPQDRVLGPFVRSDPSAVGALFDRRSFLRVPPPQLRGRPYRWAHPLPVAFGQDATPIFPPSPLVAGHCSKSLICFHVLKISCLNRDTKRFAISPGARLSVKS